MQSGHSVVAADVPVVCFCCVQCPLYVMATLTLTTKLHGTAQTTTTTTMFVRQHARMAIPEMLSHLPSATMVTGTI